MPLNAHKGGANRQLYIAISPELLIRQKSDLRNEFRPRNELRGWPAITPKQIPHGWRPPSWKSIWRHNNFRRQWSDLDEIRYPAEWHADYGEMFEIETGNRIAAVDISAICCSVLSPFSIENGIRDSCCFRCVFVNPYNCSQTSTEVFNINYLVMLTENRIHLTLPCLFCP